MSSPGNVAILGAGTMGSALAEIAHERGLHVRLHDVDEDALKKAPEGVETRPSLQETVQQADLVVEAVPEDFELKRSVLKDAQTHAPSEATFATNTSAIRITHIQEGLPEPSSLTGMHFFHPVDRMDLVEIIPGEATSEGALEAAQQASRTLGKSHVTLDADPPGFVTTRLVLALGLSALRASQAGVADKETIDASMRRDGFPMGPFEVMDHSGLDVTLQAAAYLSDELDSAYEPPDKLQDLIEQGRLGAKAGAGFYDWSAGVPEPKASGEGAFEPSMLWAVVANEASRLVDDGVADAERVDRATRKGLAFPKGPLEWAGERPTDELLQSLHVLHQATEDPLAMPSRALRESARTRG